MESRNSEIKRRKGANKRIKQTERDVEFHIINLAGERRGGGGGGGGGGSFKPPPHNCCFHRAL